MANAVLSDYIGAVFMALKSEQHILQPGTPSFLTVLHAEELLRLSVTRLIVRIPM